MACRLPTVSRYRSERRTAKAEDGAARAEFAANLASDVANMRAANIETLCDIAAFVNDSANDTYTFLTDRRAGRGTSKAEMQADLHGHRTRIRADMERIVSTDFH